MPILGDPILKSKTLDIDVVGGGIAGLLIAYYAVSSGLRVRLFEKSNRLGGLISTTYLGWGRVESAINGLPLTRSMRDLGDALGVEWRNAERTERFIVRNGKLRRWPLTLHESAMALAKMAVRTSDGSEQTVADYFRNHFGVGALEYLASPMIRGIFAVDPERIDMQTAFPLMRVGGHLLRQWFSSARPEKKFQRETVMSAPENGMQELITKLEAFLIAQPKCSIHLNHAFDPRVDRGNHSYLMICTEAEAAANILARSEIQNPSLLHKIRSIPYASLTTTGCLIRTPKTFEGLGFLVPRLESTKIFGVLFSSSMFPGSLSSQMRREGRSLWTVFHSFDWAPSREELAEELNRLVPALACNIEVAVSNAWKNAIPIYNRDLLDLRTTLQAVLQYRSTGLFGNYTGAISLRRMQESASQSIL